MLRFYLVDLMLVMVWSVVSAHSNLFIPIFQCDLGGIFCLGGLSFLVGSSNLWVCFGGCIYLCLRLESAYH